jgi:hypothetical protein
MPGPSATSVGITHPASVRPVNISTFCAKSRRSPSCTSRCEDTNFTRTSQPVWASRARYDTPTRLSPRDSTSSYRSLRRSPTASPRRGLVRLLSVTPSSSSTTCDGGPGTGGRAPTGADGRGGGGAGGCAGEGNGADERRGGGGGAGLGGRDAGAPSGRRPGRGEGPRSRVGCTPCTEPGGAGGRGGPGRGPGTGADGRGAGDDGAADGRAACATLALQTGQRNEPTGSRALQ